MGGWSPILVGFRLMKSALWLPVRYEYWLLSKSGLQSEVKIFWSFKMPYKVRTLLFSYMHACNFKVMLEVQCTHVWALVMFDFTYVRLERALYNFKSGHTHTGIDLEKVISWPLMQSMSECFNLIVSLSTLGYRTWYFPKVKGHNLKLKNITGTWR
jgi:hypothetical protein